ncbi:MAG: hypothetical protein ISS77_03290 [Phycisphaerae bacterium]|nr:hypothetical protein [Phycisphaerae bacterium]
MRWLRFGFLIVLLSILQIDFVRIISVGGVYPNLLLVAMVFFALSSTTTDAIITSFSIGLAVDMINVGHVMGPGILSFGLLGTLLAYLNRVVEIRGIGFEVLTVFISGVSVGVIFALLETFRAVKITADTKIMVFGTAVYSGLLAAFLFRFFAFVMKVNVGHHKR